MSRIFNEPNTSSNSTVTKISECCRRFAIAELEKILDSLPPLGIMRETKFTLGFDGIRDKITEQIKKLQEAQK